MRKILVGLYALLIAYTAAGHTQSDSIKAYFPLNQSLFNPAFGDNASSVDLFIGEVVDAVNSADFDYMVIKGYASPDGPLDINNRLALERCKTLADYVSAHTGVSRDKIHTHSGGVAWDELRRLVNERHDVPDRDSVIEILDNPSINTVHTDHRKDYLILLNDGKPYKWLLDNIFPQLRYALAISVYCKSDDSADATRPAIQGIGNGDDVSDSDSVDNTLSDSAADSQYSAASDPSVVSTVLTDETQPRYQLAVKTNLPYYAILMPNVELEWLFKDRWSVALDADIVWLARESRQKAFRIAFADAELRHWIKPRAPWHGIYVGVFAGGGLYDLENGSRGYQGEGGFVGLSLGYMWPVSRHLSFEAGIGAGYLYTRVREYEPYEEHYVYQRTKTLNYFGPLKLKFSIVWRFLDSKKHTKNPPVI